MLTAMLDKSNAMSPKWVTNVSEIEASPKV